MESNNNENSFQDDGKMAHRLSADLEEYLSQPSSEEEIE